MIVFLPKLLFDHDKTPPNTPNVVLNKDLRKKGVSSAIIKEVLHDEVNDLEGVKKACRQRAQRYDNPAKLKAYLLRAGFNYDDINRVIARLSQ